MDYIPAAEFLSWARVHAIAPDPECLCYLGRRSHDRFWEVPQRAADLPFFLNHLLEGLDPWEHCYLWPRRGWAYAGTRERPKEQMYGIILDSAGIRPDFDGAVRYPKSEMEKLTAAAFASLVFGWTVADDLFVIPDHARQIVQTSHHEVVHVTFAEEQRVATYVEHMAAEEYVLPSELPDATFKRPDWMA